jgi:oxygen-independent coproporphyrinogen-3 oxidase
MNVSDDDKKKVTGKGEPATALGIETSDTGVGSNFVSNYPPYSIWRQDQVDLAERALDEAPASQASFGLYVHIPFCRKRCKFCYYMVLTEKNSADIQRYVDAVLREAELSSARAAVAGRPLKFVYFGGGTPSFISARHMRQLVGGLRGSLNWDGVEEVTFECEPGTLTQSKLEAIREAGVTRLSRGIQNFNDEILEANGRAHTTKEIFRVAPWVRGLGFEQLNIDLIAGLVGENWDTWKDSVDKALEMAPDSVTVYQMELPYNTIYSRQLLDGTDPGVADWNTKRAWHEYAFNTLADAGYEMSSAYTMVKPGGRFVYRDSVWHGSDLLGIGVSSFGHIGGVHYQNQSRWEPYLQAIEAGRSAIDRAYETAPEERVTREMILLLKRGFLEPAYFQEKYSVDILKRHDQVWDDLRDRGLLDFDRERIELTQDGLLRVDQLLSEFYDKKYRDARYT